MLLVVGLRRLPRSKYPFVSWAKKEKLDNAKNDTYRGVKANYIYIFFFSSKQNFRENPKGNAEG